MSRTASLALVLLLSLSLLVQSASAGAQCSGGGFDLHPLTYADYYSPVANGTQFIFHPCGNVTNSVCAAVEQRYHGAMVCQVQLATNTTYELAVWDPSTTYLSTDWIPIHRGSVRGVQMHVRDGQGCGGDTSFPREFRANFYCDASLQPGQAVISSCYEPSVCSYSCDITTSAVCTPVASTCGGAGVDFSSLTGTDLIYTDARNNYTYYYRPCGVVDSPQCANNPYGNVAGEAMMCQAHGTNGELDVNTYDLAWWNPTIASWEKRAWGVQMFIEDGTNCLAAGGRPRALTVNFICDAASTTARFVNMTEPATCEYVATIYTSAACANLSQIVTDVDPCGGAYNLNVLGQTDLVWSNPAVGSDEQIVFRPCGVVRNQKCQNNVQTNHSMVCQTYQSRSDTYDIADYEAARITYQPIPNGEKMMVQDGQLCGAAGPRALTVMWQCQNPGLPDYVNFWKWEEESTCHYVAWVNTSLVCAGLTPPNGLCGMDGYDYSIIGEDLQMTTSDGSYTFFMRPCGQVRAPQCLGASATTQASMVCQAVLGSSTTYNLGVYDSNLAVWSRIPNGHQMFIQDGSSCGNAGYERALSIRFICASTVQFLNMSEPSTCNYVAYVQTPQACAPVANGGTTGVQVAYSSTGGQWDWKGAAYCGGPYDLSSLANSDLALLNVSSSAAGGTAYNWYLRPCGVVSAAACQANVATSNVMLCQAEVRSTATYNLAYYDPFVTQYTPIRNGVIMSVADGSYCGSAHRVVNTYFQCDPTATTAKFWKITESPQCTYNAYVNTSLVCPQTGATCGAFGVDLSPLTHRADLTINYGGYNWYLKPCGTVQASQCQTNIQTAGVSMLCQASTTSTTTYDVAVYIPSRTQWNRLPNGIQMVTQDGQTCGSLDYERRLTINFICGPKDYQFTSIVERATCDYVANITTKVACGNYSEYCGDHGFNLTPLMSSDLVFKTTSPGQNYTYYYRPCGVVSSPQCANNPYGNVAGEAMMCQATGQNGELDVNTYDLAIYDPDAVTWERKSNGIDMFIEDGSMCGSIPRQLTVHFVCNPAASVAQFTRMVENSQSICFYEATIETNLACVTQEMDNEPSICGGPYNLKPLTTQDLVFNSPGSTQHMVFRPCGVVSEQKCLNNTQTAGSMMCQTWSDSTTTFAVSTWNPAAAVYTPIANGIRMVIQDGQQCDAAGGPRKLTVNFVCQFPGAGRYAVFTDFQEVGTCNYVATVATSLVCPGPGPANGLCGADGYDYSIIGDDLQYTTPSGSYVYYFRPCGQVVAPQCNSKYTNGLQSMMCQAVLGSSTVYDLAYYDSNLVQWTRTANGHRMFVQDGLTCGNADYERALTVNFVCDRTPGARPNFVNLTEVKTCSYLAIITTPQACGAVASGASTGIAISYTGGNPWGYKDAPHCGGPYDLAPLVNQTDLRYVNPANNFTFVFRPCGVVSDPVCMSDTSAKGSMFCQYRAGSTNAYSLSVYDPVATVYQPTRRGVRMTVQDGEPCGFNPRIINVNFECDAAATTPVMYNVTESPQCTYNAYVTTNLVCALPSTTCGGLGYDLTALTTGADLTTRANGYDWYFRPCGTVVASQCQYNEKTAGTSMMCQAAIGTNSTWNIASNIPQDIQWSELPNGQTGVAMRVQDGATCDGYDYERLLTVNFLCDPNVYANFTAITEATICNYVANVTTRFACNKVGSGSSGGGSSLSGGAIAGIVIGSVVGALILVALLLVACCVGKRGGKKSSTDMSDVRGGGGKFNEMEPSGVEMSQAEQSHVGSEHHNAEGEHVSGEEVDETA